MKIRPSVRTTALAATPLACALAALAPSPAALAQTERELGAHEHGAATLGVVLDGSTLSIELESPWANLVGFEHAPSTDEQRAAVDEALDRLSRPEELFVTRGGDCTVADASVSSTLGEDGEHHGDEEHHDEDEHHGDEEHAESEDRDHGGHEGGEVHSEVLAEYAFECADPADLEAIEVALLDAYSGIEDLDVQLAGPGGQDAVELGGGATELDLEPIR